MPKMKSHSGAAKRFRATATGRFKCRHSHTSHILTKKTSKRKRQLRQPDLIAVVDTPAVRQLLPYA